MTGTHQKPPSLSLEAEQPGRSTDLEEVKTQEAALLDTSTADRHWYELRVDCEQPDRRAYHSAFIYEGKFFIFGGKDIREGQMNSLWCFDLEKIGNLSMATDIRVRFDPLEWHRLDLKGKHVPRPVSHHTSVIYENKMYLFGGINGIDSNEQMYSLNLNDLSWELIQQRAAGNLPQNKVTSRDEHSAILLGDHMIVYGGFKEGERCNDIFKFSFHTSTWEQIVPEEDSLMPCPRAGHSAVHAIDKDGSEIMLVFGGKDDENQKLSDLWKFSFKTLQWTLVDPNNQQDECPDPRSGHSAAIYNNDYMVIFGGIFEITRELNDCHIYSIRENKWYNLFEETGPAQQGKKGLSLQSLKTRVMDSQETTRKSPTIKKKQTMKQQAQQDSSTISSTKKGEHQITKMDLESPTSVSMKNSFIIQNQDPCFDILSQGMRKGRVNQINFGWPSDPAKDQNMSRQSGRRPAPRDGHTCTFMGSQLIVFGGDRHHMPFNDLFVLDLEGELRDQSGKGIPLLKTV